MCSWPWGDGGQVLAFWKWPSGSQPCGGLSPGAQLHVILKDRLSRCPAVGDRKEQESPPTTDLHGDCPTCFYALFCHHGSVGVCVLRYYWERGSCRKCLKLQGASGWSSKINEAKLLTPCAKNIYTPLLSWTEQASIPRL